MSSLETFKQSVGIAVITHSATKHLPKILPLYLNSPLKPKVLVVNSSSHDGTVEMARDLGADVLVIPRKSFNHGATREIARKYLKCDIVVMATPDAYPRDAGMLEILLQPIFDKKASIAYARQTPHIGATFLEAFPGNLITQKIASFGLLPMWRRMEVIHFFAPIHAQLTAIRQWKR